MDSEGLQWYLKSGAVEKLKQWKAEHDGVVCDHYLLRSTRSGAWGDMAIKDVYITLPDGKTYSSMRLWHLNNFDIKAHRCCLAESH